MNDGTEQAELQALNAYDIQRLNTQLKLAKGNATDGYRQLGEATALLREARELLEVVFDKQLHGQIQALIKRIDEFYPQGD